MEEEMEEEYQNEYRRQLDELMEVENEYRRQLYYYFGQNDDDYDDDDYDNEDEDSNNMGINPNIPLGDYVKID